MNLENLIFWENLSCGNDNIGSLEKKTGCFHDARVSKKRAGIRFMNLMKKIAGVNKYLQRAQRLRDSGEMKLIGEGYMTGK